MYSSSTAHFSVHDYDDKHSAKKGFKPGISKLQAPLSWGKTYLYMEKLNQNSKFEMHFFLWMTNIKAE